LRIEKQLILGAIVFFDGVCNLCNGAVRFIIRRDKHHYFQFSSLQSDFAKGYLSEKGFQINKMESILLAEGDKIYNKSTAVLRISRHLSGAWKICASFLIIPRFIRNGLYDYIAKHRYAWFGRREECMIPDESVRDRFLS